ncbi:hypothetical protein SAY87_020001 [Trapa incisa]|uniref:Uncharacterized protein n=1 Tax=Trapa incisa TaxID=236973 RepID=A0AAN7K0R6_9MYRT|nr:hypothetical protein SAY87_020001 [Trapa incisa]
MTARRKTTDGLIPKKKEVKHFFCHSSRPPLPPSTSIAVETSAPFLDDPFRPCRFLTNNEFEKLRILEGYFYS